MGVCTDEPARAELDPAEVADDGDGDIRDTASLDCFEDGAARRPARLAVVTRALPRGIRTEDHGVGRVARIVVLLFQCGEPCAHLVLVLRVYDVGEEAGTLDLIRNRGDTALRYLPCDGRVVTIRTHLFLRLKYSTMPASSST